MNDGGAAAMPPRWDGVDHFFEVIAVRAYTKHRILHCIKSRCESVYEDWGVSTTTDRQAYFRYAGRAKIKLCRLLFHRRDDMYAKRWEKGS